MINDQIHKFENLPTILLRITYFLLKLTDGELAEDIEPTVLSKLVLASLHVMETYPNHHQLQMNALSIICNENILKEVVFDRYDCSQILMNSLFNFNNTDIHLMALEIFSIISSQLSIIEKSNLCSNP